MNIESFLATLILTIFSASFETMYVSGLTVPLTTPSPSPHAPRITSYNVCYTKLLRVNADQAGVMFTVNPINHDYNQMVIEGAWGLGEGVVSGTVSPDTYIVSKDTEKVVSINVARKDSMFIKDVDGVTKEVETPSSYNFV